MSMGGRRMVRAAAWVAVGVVGVGLLAGVALADGRAGSGPSGTTQLASTSSNASAADVGRLARRPGLRRLAALGPRVLHGQLTVRTKTGLQTVDVQLGQVTAASESSMTVRSSDGFTLTWAVAATTRVRQLRAAARPGITAGSTISSSTGAAAGSAPTPGTLQIVVGQTVRVVGVADSNGATARLVLIRPPA
jgi:hypothetical protein